MRLGMFVAITTFIFLAIVGGLIGIVLEGRRIPLGSGAHNPATQRHRVSDRRLGEPVRALSRARVRARRGHDVRVQDAARHARGAAVLLRGALDRMADLALGAAHPREPDRRPAGRLAHDPVLARCAFRSCSSPRSCRRRSNSRAPPSRSPTRCSRASWCCWRCCGSRDRSIPVRDRQLLRREQRDHAAALVGDHDLLLDARGRDSRPWPGSRFRARTPCLP